MSPAVRSSLQEFFRTTLNQELPADNEELLATGRLDSLGIVELMLFLEQQHGVRVRLETLEFDDVRTPEAIARLIERHG